MSLSLGDGVLRILGDTSDVDRKLSGLKQRASGLQGSLAKIGKGLAVGGVVALTGAVVKGTMAFAGFEDAMTKSLAIMGDVDEFTRTRMENTAREIAKTTTFSAEQAAEAYFYLASAGYDAEQSMAALPGVAAFAQAGNFDLALATDLLTDAQSALGLSSKDATENLANQTRLADVLVGANTKANASVQQFSEALTNKAGNAMSQLNIDVEDGVAVLAAWADQGVKGAEAGERFNIVTRDLQTAARNNADTFKDYGISVFDAQGNFRNMADIIGDLEGALEGMSAEQQGATLSQLGFTDRSIAATRSLLGASEKIRGYSDDLRGMGGVTDEVASKQLESFKAKLSILGSKLTDLSMVLAGPVLDGLTWLVEKVSGFLDILSDGGNGPINEFVHALQSLFSWLGGGEVFEDSPLYSFLPGLNALRDGVRTTFAHISNAFTYFATNVLPVLQTAFAWIVDFVQNVWTTQIGPQLSRAFDLFGRAIGWVTSTILPVLQEWLSKIVGWVTANWPLISNAFNLVSSVVGTVIGNFINVLNLALEAVMLVWPSIQVVIETVVGVIAGIIEVFLNLLAGNWGAAWDAILGIFVTIWDGIVAFIGTVPDLILGILKGLLAAVLVWAGALGAKLLGAIGGIVARFVGVIGTLPGKALGAIGSLIPRILSFLGSLLGKVVGWLGRFIGKIFSWFSKAPGKAVDGLKTLPGKIIGFLGSIPGKIMDAALGIGGAIMGGIVRGVTNAVSGAIDAVTGAVGGIVDGVAGFLGIASPSKVFAEIGGYSMDGLAEGLSDARAPMAALDETLGALTGRAPIRLAAEGIGSLGNAAGGVNIYGNINLPNVTDADGFVDALRHMSDSRG